MAYTPEAIAGLKLREADKLRTKLLEIETSLELLNAWGGSDNARAAIKNATEEILSAIVLLESSANLVIAERDRKRIENEM